MIYPIVITSYSIHYTKLYESRCSCFYFIYDTFVDIISFVRGSGTFQYLFKSNLCRLLRYSYKFIGFGNFRMIFISSFRIRITSYNVCYTKLLRTRRIPLPKSGRRAPAASPACLFGCGRRAQ